MFYKKKQPDKKKLDRIIAEARLREKTYRERALKIHPWICAWCGREHSGKKVAELTVHHKDYDHDNNPPDGSNWELLCIYCHEQVHSRKVQPEHGEISPCSRQKPLSTYSPFANLKELLNHEENPSDDAIDKDK